MTLVLATTCRDGILLAADGHARKVNPKTKETISTVEDAKKIFPLGDHCAILVAGALLKDMEQFLGDLSLFSKSAAAGRSKSVKEWNDACRQLLGHEYRQSLGDKETYISIIVAGYTLGTPPIPEIYTSWSFDGFKEFPPVWRWSSGSGDAEIADAKFTGLNASSLDLVQAKELSKDILEEASAKYKGVVGGELVYFSITPQAGFRKV